MPYKSAAQRRYFNYAAAHGVGGITPAVADEWNQASKGKKLPERVDKNESRRRAAAAALNPPRKKKRS